MTNPASTVGRVVDLTGYEEVARAQWDRGTVRVVHNNSTHYLVAFCEDRVDGIEPTEGLVKIAIPYGTEVPGPNWKTAYHNALATMIAVVLARCDDDTD